MELGDLDRHTALETAPCGAAEAGGAEAGGAEAACGGGEAGGGEALFELASRTAPRVGFYLPRGTAAEELDTLAALHPSGQARLLRDQHRAQHPKPPKNPSQHFTPPLPPPQCEAELLSWGAGTKKPRDRALLACFGAGPLPAEEDSAGRPPREHAPFLTSSRARVHKVRCRDEPGRALGRRVVGSSRGVPGKVGSANS